ncbi:hypothetical protein CIB93_14725 [Streptomyces sp. WZ.A104]|nr:hypothetical protein CIB93_14725 [Streptomyces sp. WZ.A104]
MLTVLTLVHHTIDPDEAWGLNGPDVFVFIAAIAYCAWAQHAAPWDRLIIDKQKLLVRTKRRNEAFSIDWASLDRIGVSEGGSSKVVVWYPPGIPAPDWVTNGSMGRSPERGGYVVYRATRRTGLHVPDLKLVELRGALIQWAGPKYVTLPSTPRQ